MANFWERAAHSVNHMFSSLCLFAVLFVSHLGFEGGNLALIAQVPDHCLPFTLHWYSVRASINRSIF